MYLTTKSTFVVKYCHLAEENLVIGILQKIVNSHLYDQNVVIDIFRYLKILSLKSHQQLNILIKLTSKKYN